MNCASYHYSFATKAQNYKFDRGNGIILLATITYLLPKLKFQIRPRQRPSSDFRILLATIIYLVPKFIIENAAAAAAEVLFSFLLATTIYLDKAL